MFKIDKDIPLTRRVRRAMIPKYPFVDMDVDDSFFVPFDYEPSTDLVSLKKRVYSAATYFRLATKHKYRDWKFVVVINEANNGVRCWRIR